MAQIFFCLDADTKQPVCFTTGTSARTVTQATPELLKLTNEIGKESTCRAGGFGMPLKGAEFLLFILRPLLPFLAFHAPPSLDPLRITPHDPLAPNSRNSFPLCFPLHHTIPREQPHRHLLS
jgi:hypothetical protein